MKIALLTDIHANPWALKAVLTWLDQKVHVDEIWHLGDLIGYGPDALNVLELGRKHFNFWISGNHEDFWLKLADLEDRGYFNFQTDSISNITQQIYNLYDRSIKKDAIDPLLHHLRDLHARPDLESWFRQSLALQDHHGPQCVQRGDLTLIPVHAAPSNPTEVYLYPWTDKNLLINHLFRVNEKLLYSDDQGSSVPFDTPLAQLLRPVDEFLKSGKPYLVLFGNSHVPGVYYYENGQVRAELPSAYGTPYLVGNRTVAINPGSLGHPSDGDRRAAFAILDVKDRQITFYRVEYDIGPVVENLFDDNYPDAMIREIQTASLRVSDPARLGAFDEDLKRLAASPGE
jgi:predicted phosphodiesterase